MEGINGNTEGKKCIYPSFGTSALKFRGGKRERERERERERVQVPNWKSYK